MRFELMRENPNGFLVHRLNRSATVSVVVLHQRGGGMRDRTTDLTLTKRMLYQLSYRGAWKYAWAFQRVPTAGLEPAIFGLGGRRLIH